VNPEQLYTLTQSEIPSELDDLGLDDLATKFRGLKKIETPFRAQFAHLVFLAVFAKVQRLQQDVSRPVETAMLETLLTEAMAGVREIAGNSTVLN